MNELQQQQQQARGNSPSAVAAADLFPSLEDDAKNALFGLGLTDGLAEQYAARDPRLALAVARYCAGRFQNARLEPVKNKGGFLRKALDRPDQYGIERLPSGEWVPPVDDLARKELAEKLEARKAAEAAAARSRDEERRASQERERQDRERWASLSDGERARLREKAFAKNASLRGLDADGFMVRGAAIAELRREESG